MKIKIMPLVLGICFNLMGFGAAVSAAGLNGEMESLTMEGAKKFDGIEESYTPGKPVPDSKRTFVDALVVKDRPISDYYNQVGARIIWYGENRDKFGTKLRKSIASPLVIPPAMAVAGAKIGAEQAYSMGGPVFAVVGGLFGLVVGTILGVAGGIVGFLGGGVSPGSVLNPFNKNREWESY